MNYRITIADTRFSDKKKVVEMEAPDLATALFAAGTMHGTVNMPEVLSVVKVEVPAGWIEMELP